MRRIIVGAMLAWLGAACGARRDDDASPARLSRDTTAAPPAPDARPVLLCFGTSLTAGAGLAPEEAFPALLQHKVDSAGLGFRVVNAGVSGETAAASLRRIDWLLQQPIGCCCWSSAPTTRCVARTLRMRSATSRRSSTGPARYPGVRVVVAGMRGAAQPRRPLHAGVPRFVRGFGAPNHAVLIPFLLEGVAGQADLNQADGIHPTAAGARIVADHVWTILEPVLRAAGTSRSASEAGRNGPRPAP
jgi:acyl-CoA thioesterase-1